MRRCSTKPEKEEQYDAEAYDFEDFVVLVLDSLTRVIDLLALSLVNKFFNKIVPEISRLFLLAWRPFLEPRLCYENQISIDMNIVNMDIALALGSGLDPGRVVRTLRGEHTGAWRNVMGRLNEVGSVASPEDYQHINIILTT